ncbi:MAG: InlB B-repeat-containing protein [Lachnospiraceae bacterium]|nr:InlB B-repeat-containing protein [Lachnospiraceae bacterium]
MSKGKIIKRIMGALLAVTLFLGTITVPFESVYSYQAEGAQEVKRGGYYDLPSTVESYVSSGKTLEFDLNILISASDVCKLGLYDGTTMVSVEFTLKNGDNGLQMNTESLGDGWYHYIIPFSSIPHSDEQATASVTRIRARSTFPTGTMINNITIGTDTHNLPEAFTEDYDTVTLADLGIVGTDYETPVTSGTYSYDGKSGTKSVIVEFGWEAHFTETREWKIALDTYWNENCMVWFLDDSIYFCPGSSAFNELRVKLDPITTGKHSVQFGRLRVTAGPNTGKDYVFLKVDGEVVASKYTDYYQTAGGYRAYNDVYVTPNYKVCFVTDGVSKQGFSGFAEPGKPDVYTDDYDVVTLASLRMPGTDYQTPVLSGTYTYDGKSATKSAIIKLGWEANFSETKEWKIAFDTYWNENCMVWFLNDSIYFCPGSSAFNDLRVKLDPITTGKHELEFGRLRIVDGPNAGKDYVFLKVDGEVVASKNTFYYQTAGGYTAYNDKKVEPSYTVCFVTDGVSKQGFSGFAEPDTYTTDIDYLNIGDIVPGGVVKDSVHDGHLGYTYPCELKSKTNSTVVKFVLKTGTFADGNLDGSVMVVDIGGNCGNCRSYISSGNKKSIMFGWEIEGCTSGTKSYKFEENSWYAFEQGRIRVTSGLNKGKDYVYLKINGELVSFFYGTASSRPLQGQQIYVEATQNFQVMGYNEVRVKYYVDNNLYLDQLAQKNFPARRPSTPEKEGEYFEGWYTAKTGGTRFDFENTKLKGNISLYARFTTETAIATFDAANGTPNNAILVGRDCLIPQPEDPTYSDGMYEYVFIGWKNMTTGKIFDFSRDTILSDTVFTAQYKEKEYFVSYYASGKLVEKVPFVMSNPTVSGKEPAVPAIPNTVGAWETHITNGLTKNMTVNAVYTVNVPAAGTAITLSKYAGKRIYLNTDTIHDYLSTDMSAQSAFVREFVASPHEYQDHQNTSFKWNDSGKNSLYTIYFADNAEFENAFITTSDKASLENEIGIFVPGKTYYWFVCGNNTGQCSAVDTFTTVNTPVRYITAGTVINMRDLGGKVNADGAKVRYGLLFRNAALDEYTSYVDDTARGVFNYLGMKSEIELRGGMKHEYTGWDENNPNVFYVQGANYQEIFSISNEQKDQYKAAFNAMADENNYPFSFHCSAGADRTGTLAFLIYGLLGIPYEEIRPEYELTSFSAIGLRDADKYNDNQSLDGTRRLMLEQYGGGSDNLQTAVRNFLMNYIGVSSGTLDSIMSILLDTNPEPNEKAYTVTVDVLGETTDYRAFDGIYFMPESPAVSGKIFKGFYVGDKEYDGYATGDVTLTARFENVDFEPYDVLSLIDLGIQEERIENKTNTVYSYVKTAKSGGRVLKFIMEPIGDMNGGDGPQIALTNDWNQNSAARLWLQSNTMSVAYYNGMLNNPPDVTKAINLEPGLQYDIEFSVRVMKNKGYEGKKLFEVLINGELMVQYFGCTADLSGNNFYFHGGTGSAYLINKAIEGKHTIFVDILGETRMYTAFDGVYFMPEDPVAPGKLFKGYYNGSKKYDGYSYGNINLTAKFEDMEYEQYDTISLIDLGIKENRIKNQTNSLYSYVKTAKSGGRSLQFILEPIGTMNGGDGPQIALTNDWNENSKARLWLQSNDVSQVYYSGKINRPPDISKKLSLEAGKQYEVEFAVRILKNRGYEGKKVFEVTVGGELVVQYIGCKADLSGNNIYFHGSTGAAYLINKQIAGKHTITIDVLGEKYTYQAFSGVYFMPDAPQAAGKIFRGYYEGSKKYNGYSTKDITLKAKYEDMRYEAYDTISLKDLGIKEDTIKNQTNSVYTYEKTAKSGGRLLQFYLKPIGDMKNGDGPQIALTNDWTQNSTARVWLQSNEMSHVYYHGKLNTPPDISKKLSLEAGKKYEVKFSVRVLTNSGYAGKKVFEITVGDELLVQYIGCKADLSGNTMYFHGSAGAAYLINKPVYKTVKFYNGDKLIESRSVERCNVIPKVKEPAPQGGLPFAGWYSEKTGGTLWDENVDLVYDNMSLYAHFADVKVIRAEIDGKDYIYRVPTGGTLEGLPKPRKAGNVFSGWIVNGKIFDGTVTSDMNVTAGFEPYSFDDYDEISLADLGLSEKFNINELGEKHTAGYTYTKAAKTGGRVFKAIYVPSANMSNGPQVSFSTRWDENYFAKLYFTKADTLYVYSSGIDGGLPTLKMATELKGGKEYPFEIGVRVLNNKGYKGVKVLTVMLNGELIFEEFDNRANIEGNTVFFQGMPNTGIFKGVKILNKVSFYDGETLLSTVEVTRGEKVASYGSLEDRGNQLFKGWFTEYREKWDFENDAVYMDTILRAGYETRTYPVMFMLDDVLYKRIDVAAGELIEIYDLPKKEGLVFDKWLNEDGSEYDMSAPVNGPLVLSASFKEPAAGEEGEKLGQSDLIHVIISIAGLAVVMGEVGVIAHKKRLKRA